MINNQEIILNIKKEDFIKENIYHNDDDYTNEFRSKIKKLLQELEKNNPMVE